MRLLIILFCLMIASPGQAKTISFHELLSRGRPVATKKLPYGDQPDQFGELWLPDTAGPYPIVIMIHGGCWQEDLPGLELMSYLAEDLRRSNIAVWNLEYRRLGIAGGGYPGTFLDIAHGIDHLRQLAISYHLNISHPIIVGHSAGGHLALWAAGRQHLKADSAIYTKDPLSIAAVVSLAGINDLAAYHNDGPGACGEPATIDALINALGHMIPQAYQDTSPVALLPLKTRQFIISGLLDPIVPLYLGEIYSQVAQRAGDTTENVSIANAGHFELIDPQSQAWMIIKAMLLKQIFSQRNSTEH